MSDMHTPGRRRARNEPPAGVIRERMRVLAEADIAKWGWHQVGVFPNEINDDTYFNYTAGLWRTWHPQPEIVVFALDPPVANDLLLMLVERYFKKGRLLQHGDVVEDIAEGYPMAFRNVPNNDRQWPCSAATIVHGTPDYPVVQMVLPNKDRLWPWDTACPEQFARFQNQLSQENPLNVSGASHVPPPSAS